MLLGQLLSDSWSFCKTYWKPILIAAAICGTISSFVGGGVSHKAGMQVGGMMQNMGVDIEKMEELTTRMQAGDETAGKEMEALINARFGEMTDEQSAKMAMGMGSNMIGAMAPFIGLSVLVMLLLGVASNAFFLLLGLNPTQDAMAIARRVPGLFFPLLGVWIWIFLRSFLWIPILGIIPAIIWGPRFYLAPVLLVQEKMGILQSARESYSRTKGYWGKIVGNSIVAGLCTMLASIVLSIAVGILAIMLPLLGSWVSTIAGYVFSAFMMIFMVKLSITILANPASGLSPVAAKAPAKTKKK